MQPNQLHTSQTGVSAAVGAHCPPANLSLAVSLADAGIPIFPAASKRPLIIDPFNVATTDHETVIGWFTRWPRALAAIPTGPKSGFWVLDVDGAAGRNSLNQLLAHLHLELTTDLSNVIVRTPRGGLHFYFKLRPGETPRSLASDIAPGLDTRGIGGCIMAPGNILPDGRRYELISPADLLSIGGAA